METDGILKDGGPAFPQINEWDKDKWRMGESGMTLRDYFAAAAMLGAISGGRRWRITPRKNSPSTTKAQRIVVKNADNYAELAYEIADAMLAERAK